MTPSFEQELEKALEIEGDRAIDNSHMCVPMTETLCCTPGQVESAFERGAHFALTSSLVRGLADALESLVEQGVIEDVGALEAYKSAVKERGE